MVELVMIEETLSKISLKLVHYM